MPAESRDPSGSIGSVLPAGGAGAGAGLIVQLLSCAACFLGAWVLPLRYPDLDPIYRQLLIAAGVLLLLIAGLTQFYRQQLS